MRRVPGAAEAVTGRARRRGRAATAATRSSTTSTTPRSCRGSRTAGIALFRGRGRSTASGGSRRRRGARGAPGGRPGRRHAPRDAADPRASPSSEPWTNREATTPKRVPARLVDPRRRRGRRRAGAGLRVARRQGDAHRGRAAACCRARRSSPASRSTEALAEHGVDVRTGRRRRRSRGRRRALTRRRSTTARRATATSCWSRARPHAADGGARARDRRARGRRLLEVDEHMRVAGPRLALRDRRRQRPRAAHPHGQVPGAPRLRPPPRQPRRGGARRRRHRCRRASIFTDPQVAAVGHTPSTARARPGLDVRVVDVDDLGQRGRQLLRPGAPGTSPPARRRGAPA